MMMTGAAGFPSMKTVFVAVRLSAQPSNPATRAASAATLSAPEASRRADWAASPMDSAKAGGGAAGEHQHLRVYRRRGGWNGAGGLSEDRRRERHARRGRRKPVLGFEPDRLVGPHLDIPAQQRERRFAIIGIHPASLSSHGSSALPFLCRSSIVGPERSAEA